MLPDQSKKFIEAAKEAGCSDDETAFDTALKKIGKAKPEDAKPRKAPKA
jgi:hypothetical protein